MPQVALQTEKPTGSQRGIEQHVRWTLLILSAATAALLAAHAGVSLWARHEFTQAESVVASHSNSLAEGYGIYHKLDHYPYTVSAYMPCFYLLQAGLHLLGLPIFQAGRLISILAFLGIAVLCWRILDLLTADRYVTWTGTLLVAGAADLNFWATVGQVDMLGLFFSIAALYAYLRYRARRRPLHLVWAGCFVVLAICTKQTMLAAGGTILVLLALHDRRRAVWFALCTGAISATLVLWLNHLTAGGFLDNTVWANINPFSLAKLFQHLQYLLAAAAGLIVLAAVGAGSALRRAADPLYVYLAAAAGVLLATGSKIGSDLNYEIETLVALGLCAGWSLHRLHFFPEYFRGSRGAVTLLHAPVLLQVALSLVISSRILLTRLAVEPIQRWECSQLQPYLAPERGPVISVELDPVIQARHRLDLEPLIYTLLAKAGRIDPGPLRRDLSNKKFSAVILYEDVFQSRSGLPNPEVPSLPDADLAVIRRSYRLVRHIPGPVLDGAYLYQPLP
ncbi:MAG TPA: glycosyltransferase family 39 protein [Bryobacterales bacterium]|nr:glycosyltransferase family 39 protein [Bryobacterales bacterium]